MKVAKQLIDKFLKTFMHISKSQRFIGSMN